ncbi:UNVERIFIED_CONTAM: putative beta-lysine N-acetyltransferase [Acetivibrio alkalicellulosi]
MNVPKAKFSKNRNEKLSDANLYIDYVNSRLKILEYEHLDSKIIVDILEYAKSEGVGKVIANCILDDLNVLKDAGFQIEGTINGFFKGEDAYCVAYFLDKERAHSKKTDEEDKILKMCMEKPIIVEHENLGEAYEIRNCIEKDIPKMIQLFQEVFKTYPSPVFNSEYLSEVMDDKILFKGVFKEGCLVSIASVDMDKKNLNGEITDCATYPEYRGQGLLTNLIYELENELLNKGFYCLYSLSRAINTGINMSLRKHGYEYKGRLINNCDICGGFEDMNIWAKLLTRPVVK